MPAKKPKKDRRAKSEDLMDQRGRVSWNSLEEQTREILTKLTLYEEELLRKRFGDDLLGRESQFAVSRRRLRQIEANALRKLKLPRPSKKK